MCVKCGHPTRMQVLAGISAPGNLSYKFSKSNLRSKDVWLTHVNWETANYTCTNSKCSHVTLGYGNYVTNLEAKYAKLLEEVEKVTDLAEEITRIYNADDCHILDEEKVFELTHLCEDLADFVEE